MRQITEHIFPQERNEGGICAAPVAVQIEGVCAGYGKKEILHDISLDISNGEILALIGTNGSGKSTLLKTIAGVVHPSRGFVRLGGKEISRLSIDERVRRGLGYMMQGGEIFSSLTVRENLEMGTIVAPAERENAIQEVLTLFPVLRQTLSHRAGLLSGGQRQALAFGMVLAQRPKVLLLDEPSAGLSPKSARDMLGKIRELNARSRTTVLLIEQRVHEAQQVASRVEILLDGQLCKEASKVMEDIRMGRIPPPEFCRIVSIFPLIDYLRALVRPEYVPILMSMGESGIADIAYLAIALLQSVQDEESVGIYLMKLWRSPNLQFQTRFALQFRLLDDEKLTREMHHELLQFTFDHWNDWLHRIVEDCGGDADKVIDYCSRRLSDPQFPPSKRWAYVCAAAASSDPDAVKELVSRYIRESDSILQEVTTRVLSCIETKN